VDSLAPFLPGLALSERFFHQAVAPLLAQHLPALRYGAARLGTGSEVLGFDTPQSRDHDWGPQVELYVAEADGSDELRARIGRLMADELPFEIEGYPTHFATPDVDGGQMAITRQRPIAHKVRVTTARDFFVRYLGVDPLLPRGLTPVEWLAIPEQRLRTVTSGAVFRDDLGELARARAALAYYPHDVWLYLLAAQWRRIEQEEAFVGRCGDVGDDLGSRVVTARLVRELMRLAFLLERQYAPYSKWFGTAFGQLDCASRLQPSLTAALAADSWRERERHLGAAYALVAELHNGLGITEPLPTAVSPFHGRPYLVIHGGRFAAAIQQRIVDPEVRRLPRCAGSTSQWVDSTDMQWTHWYGPLRRLYGEVGDLERVLFGPGRTS
jgi:hypothetical protein